MNKQLHEFYGPLYVATRAGKIAYLSYLNKLGKTAVFPKGYEPTQEALDDWFIWLKNVFMPLNEIMERVILERSHLIIEETMPECLLNYVTHVVGYRAILAKWEKGDFSERQSLIDFPKELDEYVELRYADLKGKQAKLLGKL